MPPSGYSESQAGAVAAFLRGCAEALARECSMNGRSLKDGVRHELANIRYELTHNDPGAIATAVLLLTERFYQALAAGEFDDPGTFLRVVDAELEAARSAILDIHVAT